MQQPTMQERLARTETNSEDIKRRVFELEKSSVKASQERANFFVEFAEVKTDQKWIKSGVDEIKETLKQMNNSKESKGKRKVIGLAGLGTLIGGLVELFRRTS